MSADKTNEELIVHKHTTNMRRGFHLRGEGIIPPTPAMGDSRWTEELILSTYFQAEHGCPPDDGMEYRVGRSEGGFDVLGLHFLPQDEWLPEDMDIDISIPLNRRGTGREITIPIPVSYTHLRAHET